MMREASLTKEGWRGKPAMLAVLLAGVVALLALIGALSPADAAVAKGTVGPINKATGFPKWYEDSNGVRLGLCLAGPLCLERLPHPNQPASVKANPALSNFPEEAFWWAGEASIDRPGGGRALLVLAREAAFANEVPKRGDQMSFSRVRVRVDDLVAGKRYTVTYPYGVKTFRAQPTDQDGGEIDFTSDIGCGVGPLTKCNFREALFGQVDPFLRWDPKVAPKAPAGYVGNPNVGHKVVGSPKGTNFFKIEGPNAGGRGTGVDVVKTSNFFVQGKKF
jgi:hypothetical protein